MEDTKEKLLADLYALRGGLSIISQNTDLIRGCFDLIKSGEDEVLQTQKTLQMELKTLDGLKKEEEKYKDEIDKQKENLRVIQSIDVRKESDRKFCWASTHHTNWVTVGALFAIFAAVIIIYTIVGFCTSIQEGDIKSDWNFFLKYIVVVDAVLLGLTIFFFVLNGLICNKRKKAENDKFEALVATEKKKKSTELKKAKEVLKRLEAKLQEIRQSIAKEEQLILQIKESIRVKQDENITEQDSQSKIVQIHLQNNKEVKTALNATYDSWLSESDWENVDLLIYYLDTGRADTLKEALGMVDRQRQTNQIVEAISVASKAIQSTIQSATMRLATAMEESFTLISKQIGAMSKNINRLGNITAEGQRVQNEQNATIAAMGAKLVHLQEEQLSSNEMTQALLEKANVSSEQLLTDLRYNQRLWIKP